VTEQSVASRMAVGRCSSSDLCTYDILGRIREAGRGRVDPDVAVSFLFEDRALELISEP
jgi:hypothetical protein